MSDIQRKPKEVFNGTIGNIGSIGGTTTNFMDYDKLAKYEKEILKDRKLVDLMEQTEELWEDYKKIAGIFKERASKIKEEVRKRFYQITEETYL